MYAVADIGGTTIRVATSEDLINLGATTIIDTPQDFDEGMQALSNAIKKNSEGKPLTRVVIGLPGVFNETKHALFRAPHLPAWEHKDIVGSLRILLNTD